MTIVGLSRRRAVHVDDFLSLQFLSSQRALQRALQTRRPPGSGSAAPGGSAWASSRRAAGRFQGAFVSSWSGGEKIVGYCDFSLCGHPEIFHLRLGNPAWFRGFDLFLNLFRLRVQTVRLVLAAEQAEFTIHYRFFMSTIHYATLNYSTLAK